MGCIFFPLELLVDGVIEGWFCLMEWIIPGRYITRTVRIVLKVFVWIFSGLLFVIMVLGVFAIISPDPDTHLLGKYMLFIPLGISAIQILFGIIVRIISKEKKQ